MANTIITTDEMARQILNGIKETAAKYGVSEVDLANALAGHMFCGPRTKKPDPR